MQHFTETFHSPFEPPVLLGRVLDALVSPMAKAGYQVAEQSPAGITWRRTYKPYWPLGVFSAPRELLVTMSFRTNGNGTNVQVAGSGPPEVERVFRAMAG